jgi:hypothetical protein
MHAIPADGRGREATCVYGSAREGGRESKKNNPQHIGDFLAKSMKP